MALRSLNASIGDDFKNCSKVIECVNLVLDNEKIKTIENIKDKNKQINEKIKDNCGQHFFGINNATISRGCKKIVKNLARQATRENSVGNLDNVKKDTELILLLLAIEEQDFSALQDLLKK